MSASGESENDKAHGTTISSWSQVRLGSHSVPEVLILLLLGIRENREGEIIIRLCDRLAQK